jgi:S-adenosylmethionine uptake transporter
MTPRDEASILPVLSVLLAVAAFTLMDAVVKAETAHYLTTQVVALRYAFGFTFAVPLVIWTLWTGHRITAQSLKANGLRGIVVVSTALSFFYAVSVLPLAEVIAITFLAPLFMALWGRLLLKEHVAPRIWAAIGIGFIGVIIIVGGRMGDGGTVSDASGIIAALSAAILYALANVLLRKQSAYDTVFVLVFLQTGVAFALVSPLAVFGWRPVLEASWWNFALAGALGTFAQVFMAWGFSRAKAAKLGVLEYTAFPWAAWFGYLFFGEVPGLEAVLGAGLIIAAALIANRPERSRRTPVTALTNSNLTPDPSPNADR